VTCHQGDRGGAISSRRDENENMTSPFHGNLPAVSFFHQPWRNLSVLDSCIVESVITASFFAFMPASVPLFTSSQHHSSHHARRCVLPQSREARLSIRSVHARSSIRAVYQSGATIGQSAFRLINGSYDWSIGNGIRFASHSGSRLINKGADWLIEWPIDQSGNIGVSGLRRLKPFSSQYVIIYLQD
jgi:hypothetical protein